MNIMSAYRVYSWGQIIYKAHSTYGPRMQSHYQLVLVHSGSVTIETDGENNLVCAGEVALLNPGYINYFKFSKTCPTHHSWIHGEPHGRGDFWTKLVPLATEIRPISERMRFLNKQLMEKPSTENPVQAHLYRTLAEAAFFEFFSSREFQKLSEPGHPSLDRTLNFLNRDFTKSINLETLGRVAGMSPQHLTRLFKTETGMTPMRYLWHLREEEGLRLLKETGLTIAEVADSCGFQNPYHFSRKMRQRYGHSPFALRKRAWNGR